MTLEKHRKTIGSGLAGPGRPAGSVNRATAEVRQAFASLVEGNRSRLQEWLDRVAEENPRNAIDLYLRMAEFVLPKLQRVDMSSSSSGEPIIVKIVRFSDVGDEDDKGSSIACG
jgi:hypothetical protein